MTADVLSSQVIIIFMPPGHFSMVIMQRGIIMPGIMGDMLIPGIIEPIDIGIIPIMRSLIIVLVIVKLLIRPIGADF